MYHLLVSVGKCSNVSAPFELSISSASICALLLLITVPTNLLVCLAILVDPNRKLRTQFNCFTFNLGLADLIVGCVAEPVSIYSHIREAFASERGRKASQVELMMFHVPYFISAMASVLSIAALGCERYFAITSPFGYRKYFNVKLTVMLSIVIWAIATTFGLLNLIYAYVLESFIFVNSAVLFTCLIICFSFYKIRHRLGTTSERWAENGVKRERDTSVQTRLTKTFAIMIGTLMSCYVPACSMVYYMNICTECDCTLIQWFRDACFWLVLLNSAIDPYVYAIRSTAFRNAIRKIITCKCRPHNKLRTAASVKFYKVKREGQRTQFATYGSVDSNDQSNESGEIVQAQLSKTKFTL